MNIENLISRTCAKFLMEAFAPSNGRFVEEAPTTVAVYDKSVITAAGDERRRVRINEPEYGVVGVDVTHQDGSMFHKEFVANSFNNEDELFQAISQYVLTYAGFSNAS